MSAPSPSTGSGHPPARHVYGPAIISAIGAVFAAVVGLFAANSAGIVTITSGPQPPSAAPGPTVTVTVAGSMAPGDVSAAPPSEPGETRTGTGLRLATYESFDFDSTEQDWGKATPADADASTGNDLRLGGLVGVLFVPGSRAVRVSGTPDLVKCTDPTAATLVGQIDVRRETGKSFCYKTNEDRFVWLTVKSLSSDDNVTVDVLVWRRPQP